MASLVGDYCSLIIQASHYANGIYDYYDVEQIEEFFAFKGACEIESLFKEFEDFLMIQFIDLKI